MRRELRDLTAGDIQVLRAVNRFGYLTAAQLNRVLWPENTGDANRYAQRRLSRLVTDEHLLPLRDVPRPLTGTAPNVYALGWRGRKALLARGDQVPFYYRPSECAQAASNPVFLPHTLAVIDVLIAAEQLTQETPEVRLQELWLERDLRRMHLGVMVPPPINAASGAANAWLQTRRVGVVPDGLFTLALPESEQHFLVEVDRGTERAGVWREKITALVLWVGSEESAKLLPGMYVTIMVVTCSERRREYLRSWTGQELRNRGLFDEFADVVKITNVSPADLRPEDFFGKEHWHPPFIGAPDSLIDL